MIVEVHLFVSEQARIGLRRAGRADGASAGGRVAPVAPTAVEQGGSGGARERAAAGRGGGRGGGR